MADVEEKIKCKKDAWIMCHDVRKCSIPKFKFIQSFFVVKLWVPEFRHARVGFLLEILEKRKLALK